MSDFSENKYDNDIPPSYEESFTVDKIAEEKNKITEERCRLIKATSELDRIKIEMEVRIRNEMEAKIRSEMEERIRQELSCKKEDDEKKKESDKQRLYKELSMETEKNNQEIYGFDLYIKKYMALPPKDEIILFNGCVISKKEGPNDCIETERQHCNCWNLNPGKHVHRERIVIIITNKNCYGVSYRQLKQKGSTYFLELLYTFDNELNSRDIAIISQLFVRKGEYNVSFIEEETPVISKKIESVIRLIPGSYKNGDWEQLDGFYGMYFNRKTLELSAFPPSVYINRTTLELLEFSSL